MKILVALDNNYIINKLKEEYKELVYTYDIDFMEGVIEFLSNIDEEYIVITKESLKGNLDSKMYIKQMRLANKNIKIIYFVNKLSSEYKEFLFANEVFNILEGEEISFEILKENINENRGIVYKVIEQKENKSLNESNLAYDTFNQVLPKQLIAVYGTSGSGKSISSSILAKNICKKLNISVALLDMDIQNPSIDILNNVEVNNDMLSEIVEQVDRTNEINSIIERYMIKDKNNKKLWYMTNNSTIFDCQNKFSNKYYEKIYKAISLKYDYTLIDLPSSPFLDVVPFTLKNADKIFFVINPNYISLRQAVKYLDLLTKLWDIPKEKIFLILNKEQKNSLEICQIESILKDYVVVGKIDFNKELESYINGSIADIDIDMNMEKIFEKFNITSKSVIKVPKKVAKNNILKFGFLERQIK